MGLHLKSTKSFKILIGFSALLISVMAATFSVTGIATLFSGYFLTVALMMGTLEFAKIVVASFLARYWTAVSRILRGYFIAALFVLILITSGGIFGYLSDAYQSTKGDYTIVEKQTEVLKNKKNRFDLNLQNARTEKQSVDENIAITLQALRDNKIQFRDTSGTLITTQSSTSRRLYQKQLDSEQLRRGELTAKIDALTDSSTAMDMKIFELESQNIQGELGPLKYIAGIFDTDMDTVVKYFIFLLIFVFDPLAVLLFVSLNLIIRKERGIYEEDDGKPDGEDDGNDSDIHGPFDDDPKPTGGDNNITVTVDAPEMEDITTKLQDDIKEKLNVNVSEPISDEIAADVKVGVNIIKDDESEMYVKELIENFENEELTPEIQEEEKEEEHEFYHGEEEKKEEEKEEKKEEKPEPTGIVKKSANYYPQ